MTHQSSLRIGRALLAALALGFAATSAALAASGARYYVNDHLATTVGITDAAGEIAALEADAFGSPLASGTNSGRFTGKPYDEDLGAYVFPFRNYRADEARWMSADPSGFPDGVNGSLYSPNPLTGLDPLGLFTLSNGFSASSVDGSYAGNNYKVSSLSVVKTGISDQLYNTLASEYADIVFTKSASTVSGTLSVGNMVPSLFGNDRGGLNVEMDYSGVSNVGLIQIITTNTPLSGRPGTTVDVGGLLRGINPYYNSGAIASINDAPNRYLDSATSSSSVSWTAYVFLAKQVSATQITVYDGIKYGFTISKE